MKLNKGQLAVCFFSAFYILAYTIYYLSIKNFEFLWYIFIMVALFSLVIFTIDRTKFDNVILWGLSIWGLLHMSGGGLIVNGDVLYNFEIWKVLEVGDTYIFKFDQFVHAFGFFVTALVAFHILKQQIKEKPNWIVIYVLAALVSMGLGAVNEIAEFIATISIDHVNVGGYYNTSIDIVSNTVGAFLAIIFMRRMK